MTRIMLAMLLLLGAAVPVWAQTDDCDIDVAGAVTLLVNAQAAASSGDATLAADWLAEAQIEIADLEDACQGATVAENDMLDPELVTYEHETDLGTLSFDYPEDWLTRADDEMVIIANSSELLAVNMNAPEPPAVASGDVAFALQLTDADFFSYNGPNASPLPIDILEEFAESVPAGFGEVGAPEAFYANDRPAAAFRLWRSDVAVVIYLLDIGQVDGRTRYVLVIMLSGPDEARNYEPLAMSMLDSVRLTS